MKGKLKIKLGENKNTVIESETGNDKLYDESEVEEVTKHNEKHI